MPKFLAPRQSGAHRIAAIALFRALLSQCKTAPVAAEQQEALRCVIRNKFKANVNLTSKNLLKDAFSAGYEGLDHLHYSTAGEDASTSYILSLLTRIPPLLKTAFTRPAPAAPTNPFPMASGWENSTLAARPRPLSALKGKRRIPVLVSANRIPYLRVTKPQSPAVSAYIKAKMVQRQRRHDRKWVLLDALQLARWEDAWDAEVLKRGVVGQQRGQGLDKKRLRGQDKGGGIKEAMVGDGRSTGVKGETWTREILSSLDDITKGLDREAEKNRLWAARMVDIIDREKELAEQERKERKMFKNREHRQRKGLESTLTDANVAEQKGA